MGYFSSDAPPSVEPLFPHGLSCIYQIPSPVLVLVFVSSKIHAATLTLQSVLPFYTIHEPRTMAPLEPLAHLGELPSGLEWAPEDPAFAERLQMVMHQEPQSWAQYIIETLSQAGVLREQAVDA